MLSLGMDGPNVNLLFQSKLLKEVSIITVGTCPLHRASTGFGKAIMSIKDSVVDLNEMAIDFHFFFKYSAVRREEYKKCDEITGVVSKHMGRHCETRWLSLEKVLVKIYEQWDNLGEYFLNKVPTVAGFKGKNGVGSTLRYARIKNYLLNKNIPPIMGVVIFLFFIKCSETNEPMIHLLHLKCMQLLESIFDKFLKSEVFRKTKKHGYVLKSVNEFIELDVKDVEHHKALCDVGSCAEKKLLEFDALEKKKLKNDMKNALVDSAAYLVNNLPLKEQVVYNAQFICHQNRHSKKALSAIKRLTYSVISIGNISAACVIMKAWLNIQICFLWLIVFLPCHMEIPIQREVSL